ncbi:MAG: hypothetical protein SGPRY_012928 [Prymnesium sp.]
MGGETPLPRTSRGRRANKRASDSRPPPVPEGEGPGLENSYGEDPSRKPPPSEYYGSMAAGSIVGANSNSAGYSGYKLHQKWGTAAPTLARAPLGGMCVGGGRGEGALGARRSGRKSEWKQKAGQLEKRGRSQFVQCHEGFVTLVDLLQPQAWSVVWLVNTVNCLTVYTSPSKSHVKLVLPHRLLRKVALISLPYAPHGIQLSHLRHLPPGARRPTPLPPDDPTSPIDINQDVAGLEAVEPAQSEWLMKLRISLRPEDPNAYHSNSVSDPIVNRHLMLVLLPESHHSLKLGKEISFSAAMDPLALVSTPFSQSVSINLAIPQGSSRLGVLPTANMAPAADASLGCGRGMRDYDELMSSVNALRLDSEGLAVSPCSSLHQHVAVTAPGVTAGPVEYALSSASFPRDMPPSTSSIVGSISSLDSASVLSRMPLPHAGYDALGGVATLLPADGSFNCSPAQDDDSEVPNTLPGELCGRVMSLLSATVQIC